MLTLGIGAGLTAALAAAVTLLPDRTGRGRRVRWACVIALSGGLIAGLTLLSEADDQATTAARLQRVIQIESTLDASGRNDRQELSALLGSFGRGESRAFSTRHARAHGRDKVDGDVTDPAKVTSAAVPWRQLVRTIATKERIVMSMEVLIADSNEATFAARNGPPSTVAILRKVIRLFCVSGGTR